MPVTDQGVTRDRYTLIPRTLIFITRGECVLLLKGDQNKRLWANQYNGIGGHIEAGEDVLSAAKRELLEETGLTSDDLYLCGTVTVDTQEQIGIGLYVFKGSSLRGDLRPSSEGGLEWVPVDQIDHKPLVEDLPVLLPRVLSQKLSDRPFAAHYYYNTQGNLQIQFGS